MSAENWYWLANGLGWGAVNSGDVLAVCPGGADEVYQTLGSDRLDDILTAKQADRLAQSRPEDFALRISHAETQGVAVLGYDDPHYPATLRNITNPPLVLFVKGDLTLLNGQLAIGMVGARRPSAYGVEATKALGRGIALGGAIIVSGLAAGLDAEAHKAALAVNGPTIACIAFGHDHCYPAANKKLMEVIERYGAVVSEYPPVTGPEKPYFLQRNRIIAGISHGLVIVEARKHSGTMSTVNFASEYGRDVFAVPGSIFSELSAGTNAIIREGAYLAGSASEVLGVYGVELDGEDPVEAAAKQAAEGRPAPASATPPWQQSLKRYTDRTREERAAAVRDEVPGQQTLGELLRSQIPDADGPVSASQAMDAFRSLQRSMPAATDSELDARNAALDEMVAAVSDSVELSGKAKKKVAKAGKSPIPAAQPADGVAPFPWDKVERIDKKKVEDLSPAKSEPEAGRGRKPSLASRLLGTDYAQPQSAASAPQQPVSAETINAILSAPPVGRVEGLSAVERVYPVPAVTPVAPASVAGAVSRTGAGRQSPAAPGRQPVAQQQAAPPPHQPAVLQSFGQQPTAGQSPAAQTPSPVEAVSSLPETPPPPPPVVTPAAAPPAPAATLEPAALEPAILEPAALEPAALEPATLKPPASEQPAPAQPGRPAAATSPPPSSRRKEPSLTSNLRTLSQEERPAQRGTAPRNAPARGAAPKAPSRAETAIPKNINAPAPNAPVTYKPPTFSQFERAKPAAKPTAGAAVASQDPASLLSDVAKRAFRELGPVPASLSDICEASGLSSAEAMAALTELELAGLSRQLAGRQFVISNV